MSTLGHLRGLCCFNDFSSSLLVVWCSLGRFRNLHLQRIYHLIHHFWEHTLCTSRFSLHYGLHKCTFVIHHLKERGRYIYQTFCRTFILRCTPLGIIERQGSQNVLNMFIFRHIQEGSRQHTLYMSSIYTRIWAFGLLVNHLSERRARCSMCQRYIPL